MCGRYGVDERVNRWLTSHCLSPDAGILRVGDIRPGEAAPVLLAGNPLPVVIPMIWGWPMGGRRVINARRETVGEKPAFCRLFRNRRCLLPASCFFEWDRGRHKVTFSGKDGSVLFLAGVYREDAGGGRFVILTGPADETVKPIHDRMPLRIPEEYIGDWLSSGERAQALLDRTMVPVRRAVSAEQLCLWEEDAWEQEK